MPPKTIKSLSEMGHHIKIEGYDNSFGFGGAQIIKKLENGDKKGFFMKEKRFRT